VAGAQAGGVGVEPGLVVGGARGVQSGQDGVRGRDRGGLPVAVARPRAGHQRGPARRGRSRSALTASFMATSTIA
jgi:hypothetical protein